MGSGYVEWGVTATAGFVRRWVGDEILAGLWREQLAELVQQRESEGFATRFAEHCPCPGAVLDDYKPRQLELGRGLSAWAGIHYGESFFVHVYALTRQLERHEFGDASRVLSGALSAFRPTGVRWWVPLDAQWLRSIKRPIEAERLVVGWLPRSERASEALSLSADPSVSVYDDYMAMYERFHEQHPDMRSIVPIERRDKLQACADAGGLFRVIVNGELAGVMAARPLRFLGIEGWCVTDEILDTRFRGRGLAPIAQHAMLTKLDRGVSKLVFGTIADVNQPSLRTALRVGRRDAGSWVMLPV